MEEKKIVVYVLHGFWENEFTNGCAVVDVSIDLEAVMKKLDEIVESKAQGYVKVQEDKAEEERGFRYFEIWDENGQSAKFYIVEQYLELSQSMMEAEFAELSREVMPVLDKLTEIAGQHGTAEKLVSITLSAEGYIHFTVHDSGMCLSRLKREDAPELEIRKQLSQEMGREEN